MEDLIDNELIKANFNGGGSTDLHLPMLVLERRVDSNFPTDLGLLEGVRDIKLEARAPNRWKSCRAGRSLKAIWQEPEQEMYHLDGRAGVL